MAWKPMAENHIKLCREIVDMDLNTLNGVIQIANERRDYLCSKELKVGAKVSFGRPNGKKHFGTIEKINISKAVVDAGDFRKYVVPFSMLELHSN